MQIAPARAAGMAASAWLYSVPYQGTPFLPGISPASSRNSNVPTNATRTAADGPPRAATATIGAIVTFRIAPPGMVTGTAELSATTAVQKAKEPTSPRGGDTLHSAST